MFVSPMIHVFCIFMDLFPRIKSHVQRYVRITLTLVSATCGLVFLSQSSFFKLQFDHTTASDIVFFGALSALLMLLVFVTPNWSEVLGKVWNLNFTAKLTVDCVFMGFVWLLAFLIKYPRFDVNFTYTKSCGFDERVDGTARGSQYSLFSVGAFALLALLLSSEGSRTTELGFLSVLIGLIMDTSLEITTTDSGGPVVWYILGSVIYSVALIFLKHHIDSSARTGDDYLVLSEADKLKDYNKRKSLGEFYRNRLVFFSALVGTICLFLSPFSEQQFEDSTNLKAICFITFSFLLGISLLKARESIDVLAAKCEKQYLVKAAVKIFLFGVVSAAIFVTKYPRFKIHSKYTGSCRDRNGKQVMSQRNQFDLYSTGSFALFALTLSSDKEQPVKLGLFTFLLELTMDTSIEILGNDEPSFLSLIFASMYCALLILIKCYLDSKIEKMGTEHVPIIPSAKVPSSQDNQPLIEYNSSEEIGHEIEVIDDLDPVTKQKNESGEEEEEEDRDSGYELPKKSHMEERAELLNHRQRHRARRREKAKRDKVRMKEKRNQQEDLWISVV